MYEWYEKTMTVFKMYIQNHWDKNYKRIWWTIRVRNSILRKCISLSYSEFGKIKLYWFSHKFFITFWLYSLAEIQSYVDVKFLFTQLKDLKEIGVLHFFQNQTTHYLSSKFIITILWPHFIASIKLIMMSLCKLLIHKCHYFDHKT